MVAGVTPQHLAVILEYTVNMHYAVASFSLAICTPGQYNY